MNNIFIIPIFTTIFYCLGKFIEIKYIEKTKVPLKNIVRDALIIFVCSLSATFIYFNMIDVINNFFNVVTENNVAFGSTTEVFTGHPEF
jgi:hypothetical protein